MLTQFIFGSSPWALPVVLLIVLGLALEIPYRFLRPAAKNAGGDEAFNAVQTGIVTLSAFVLGLSFAQASGRFEARRVLVVKEANSIGTTWLRADQLPAPLEKQFRKILTEYTAERIEAYETPGDLAYYEQALRRSLAAQDAMWGIVSPQLRAHPDDEGKSLLMQTLNETIDVSGEQLQAHLGHVPVAMVLLTIGLVVLAVFATGLRLARVGSRPVMMSVACIFAYVIVLNMSVDYDRPQTGLVRNNLAPLKLQLKTMQGAPP
jgi:hypothetical protein